MFSWLAGVSGNMTYDKETTSMTNKVFVSATRYLLLVLNIVKVVRCRNVGCSGYESLGVRAWQMPTKFRSKNLKGSPSGSHVFMSENEVMP